MKDQRATPADEELCSCGQKHTGHICWLSRMELFREVQHLSDNPTVVCAVCGARANLPHNVCSPATLENAPPKNRG